MKKHIIPLAIIILVISLISGCGGGSDVSAIPQDTALQTPTAAPGGNPSDSGGTFTVKVTVPGSSESKDISVSVIPYQFKTLKVTIEGDAISTPLTGEEDISGGGTFDLTIENVPVGLNIATIEVLTEDETLLALRKHSFYMSSGGVAGPGTIPLGVGIESTGSANPSLIDIPVGTTIFFQNLDYDNDRTVRLTKEGTSDTIEIGPITSAAHSEEPLTPDTFSGESYTFSEAGTYNYDTGYGSPGRVLVYDLPAITSIIDDDGNAWDSTNSTSTVNFTVTGTNFGTDLDMVDGEVTFYKTFDWLPVGDKGFSSGETSMPSLDVYDGTPYIAYTDHANGYGVTVMMYDGSSWEIVGTEGFSDGGAAYISLDVYDGIPYVAYKDDLDINDWKATVMKYEGGSWELVGDKAFSDDYADSISLCIYNGTPYVAYVGSGITVMMYDGINWVPVGNKDFASGNNISLDVYNGTPYVAYKGWGGKASVVMYSGSSWEFVGNEGFSDSVVWYTSLDVYNGTPYVAYQDLANGCKATVMMYNGTSWVPVGNKGFSLGWWATYTSLQVYNGTPYLAYADYFEGTKASLMMYNGSNWISVGDEVFSDGYADEISLSVYNGTPYVAYRDHTNDDYKATVMKYTADTLPFSSTVSSSSWTDTEIQGTVEIPGGKYRVEVRVRGENTTDNVRYFKGVGSYEVEVD